MCEIIWGSHQSFEANWTRLSLLIASCIPERERLPRCVVRVQYTSTHISFTCSLACSLSLYHSPSLSLFRIQFENILYECASACAIYCVSNKWRFFILSLYIQDRLCSQFRQIHISLYSTLCIKFAFISRVLRFIFRVVKLFLNIL